MHLILCHYVKNLQFVVIFNCHIENTPLGYFASLLVTDQERRQKVPLWSSSLLTLVSSAISLIAVVLVCIACMFIKRAMKLHREAELYVLHICSWCYHFSLGERQNKMGHLYKFAIYQCFIHVSLHI